MVGLDARGFLLGPLIALRLGAAFVPVRKDGKLPGACVKASYKKEYGEVRLHICIVFAVLVDHDAQDIFEMQTDAIKPGQTVVVVDDLIATGGSAACAGDLVRQLGGKVLEYLFVVELSFLSGGKQLDAPSWSIVKIDAE